jgi:acyltransferase
MHSQLHGSQVLSGCALEEPETMTERLEWPDVLRGLGMIGVYFGHFAGNFALLGDSTGQALMKFLSVTVVPALFMLSGYLHRYRGGTFGAYLLQAARTRLLPVLVFQTLGLFAFLTFLTVTQRMSMGSLEKALIRYVAVLAGWPFFAAVCWFLCCLFTVELWNELLDRFTRASAWRVGAIVVGVLAAWLIPFDLPGDSQYRHPLAWWFFLPALAMTAFYQLGVLVRRLELLPSVNRWRDRALASLFLVLSVLTFDLNQGPFPESRLKMPLVGLSQFGNVGWLYFGGLLGCLLFFFASRLLKRGPLLQALGQNSVALMGLNGLFMLYFNLPLAVWTYRTHGLREPWQVVVICILGTVASLLLTVPVIRTLNRFAPSWVGRRRGGGSAGVPGSAERTAGELRRTARTPARPWRYRPLP